jgi:hypothetical protein
MAWPATQAERRARAWARDMRERAMAKGRRRRYQRKYCRAVSRRQDGRGAYLGGADTVEGDEGGGLEEPGQAEVGSAVGYAKQEGDEELREERREDALGGLG